MTQPRQKILLKFVNKVKHKPDSFMAKNKRKDNDIIIRADGTKVKISGYQAPQAPIDAPKFKAKLKASKLPPVVDLRPYMTQIENQETLGSCSANAAAGAYEYLINRNQGINTYDVSRLFLYYNTRVLMGTEDEDSGGFLSSVLEALHKKGICNEELWPYKIKKFAQKPPKECYQEANGNKIEKYEYVDTDLDTWKSVLAQGYPIIFGMQIFDSFQTPRRGLISLPRRNDNNLGGHAMLCVGYSDPDNVFIVRNSWGTQWGDGGYCYIPYDYMMSDLNNGDSWVIYDVNKIELEDAEETWSEDEDSLFVNYDDEFSNMDPETWQEFNDAMGEYGFEYRLSALFLFASVMDGEWSEEELSVAAYHLHNLFAMFQVKMDPAKVLSHTMDLAGEGDFGKESAEIFKTYLSPGALANIYQQMVEVAAADGLHPGEEEFLNYIAEYWLGDVEDWENLVMSDEEMDALVDEVFQDEDDYEPRTADIKKKKGNKKPDNKKPDNKKPEQPRKQTGKKASPKRRPSRPQRTSKDRARAKKLAKKYANGDLSEEDFKDELLALGFTSAMLDDIDFDEMDLDDFDLDDLDDALFDDEEDDDDDLDEDDDDEDDDDLDDEEEEGDEDFDEEEEDEEDDDEDFDEEEEDEEDDDEDLDDEEEEDDDDLDDEEEDEDDEDDDEDFDEEDDEDLDEEEEDDEEDFDDGGDEDYDDGDDGDFDDGGDDDEDY